jgi:predicted AlkP superfamily phosphohydrolase/phosphomutase
LANDGVDSTVVKMPSNYPAEDMKRGRALAGMGTPDIYGGHGTFTLYSTRDEDLLLDLGDKGHIYPALFDEQHRFFGQIEGPANTLKIEPEPTFVDFVAYWDRRHKTARIDIGGREVLLEQGKLSPWVPISFNLLSPLASVSAITRFQLLEADKGFRLYIYPPSIDPSDPAQTISSPSGYSQELSEKVGTFHTLGLPADFNGIKTEVLSMGDYITQSEGIMAESRQLFNYEFERFRKVSSGLLFFYFSSADQGSHIYWALGDTAHPAHKPSEALEFGDQIARMYVQFDEVVGQLMAQLPASVPVMLLSDHGFAPLRRQINLNTLLYEQGFLNFYGEPDTSMSLITQADWDQTEAYALGLNGIYLNQLGREGNGIVPSQRRDEVLGRIRDGLLAYKDPENGESPFARVFITSEIYKGANLKLGPDIIVGCKSPYGLDYSAATGGIAEKGVIPNTSRWSGDHIIDPHMVPAMLMTNFKRSDKTPVIWDLAPTILTLFGQVPPEIMRGKSVV